MSSAAISTAMKTRRIAKPIATPIRSSCASMKRPPHDAGSISGVFTVGATTRLMSSASATLPRAGNCAPPVTGATASRPRMRVKGQMNATSQAFSCAAVTVITAGLSYEQRNVGEDPLRVVDQQLQYPRPGDDDRDEHAEELGNERERHLVDLRRGLEHADDETHGERGEEERRGDEERELQR